MAYSIEKYATARRYCGSGRQATGQMLDMVGSVERTVSFGHPPAVVGCLHQSLLLTLELLVVHRRRGVLALVYRLADAADGAAHGVAQTAQTLGAEQHHHDQQDDQKLPDTDAHHIALLLCAPAFSDRSDCHVNPSAGACDPCLHAVLRRPARGMPRRYRRM